MAYPTTLETYTDPFGTDPLNAPDHAGLHVSINGVAEQLQIKVGIDGSGVVTSLDYLIKNPASVEPGHKHSKLWASDGDPQSVDIDAAGDVSIMDGRTLKTNLIDTVAGDIVIASAFRYGDNIDFKFGDGSDCALHWGTAGNDHFRLGLRVNNAAYSGHLLITDYSDIWNDMGQGLSADPTVRIYSRAAGGTTDWIELFHNMTSAVLGAGAGGDLRLQTNGGTDAVWINGSQQMGVGVSPLSRLTVEGIVTLKEQAAAGGDNAGYGQLWVKNDAPNVLMFTDDAGTDWTIGLS